MDCSWNGWQVSNITVWHQNTGFRTLTPEAVENEPIILLKSVESHMSQVLYSAIRPETVCIIAECSVEH